MEFNDSIKNLTKLRESLPNIPNLSSLVGNLPHQNFSLNLPEMPEFNYEDSARYVMDKQLEEIQSLNNETKQQNQILIQNYNQLKELFDIQKEQLVATQKQNDLLQSQLDNEKTEKQAVIYREKKSKKWVVLGKVLSIVMAIIVFVLPIIISLYPEESKAFIEKTFFSQTQLTQEETDNG